VLGKNKERWEELCELAAKEQDPKKVIELMQEINRLLEIKLSRLKVLDHLNGPRIQNTNEPDQMVRPFITQLSCYLRSRSRAGVVQITSKPSIHRVSRSLPRLDSAF
jgi:hypothetical protein